MGRLSTKIAGCVHRIMSRDTYYSEIFDAHWQNTHGWESWAAADVDFWWDAPEAACLTTLANLWEHDPEAAFSGYKELADVGSVHAMIWLGHCYEQGHGTAANFDKAYDSYDRAIDAGSWKATLDMADLLFKHAHYGECEAQLQEGVDHDFIPAFYWLAWYRIKKPTNPATQKEVEPLLRRAADEGHPQARSFYAVAMAFGMFGWRKIPRGLKLMKEDIRESREWRQQNLKVKSAIT